MGLFDNFTNMRCGECGVIWGMDSEQVRYLRETGATWYCPNGHPRVFRPSENEKLREQLKQMEKFRDNAVANGTHWQERYNAAIRRENALERQNRTLRGWITRLKRTIKNRTT